MLAKLTALAKDDPNVILLTGDLGFGVFESFAESFPQQFYNVGIGEQNMIGLAAGLALDNKKVFVYSIGNFPTLRCLEQIRNDLCYHELPVTIISQGGGFNYGGLGMSHHATEDLSILRALPGVTVVAPSNQRDTAYAVEQLYQQSGVGYLRLEKTTFQPDHVHRFEIGKAITLKEGNDIAIIAIGGIVQEAVKAARHLKKENIHCRVIDLHSLKPLDEKIILAAATETSGILTVEENSTIGGLYSAVAEVLSGHRIQTNIEKIGMKDCYSSIVGDQAYLRAFYKMDSTAIISTIKQMSQGLS